MSMNKRIFLIGLTFLCSMATFAWAQNKNNYSFLYLQDTLSSGSATGSVANTWNSREPFKFYSLAVAPSAGSGAWNVVLQGSLDGNLWSTIVVNSSVTYTAGALATNTTPIPALYLRTQGLSLAGGLSVTATVIGVW